MKKRILSIAALACAITLLMPSCGKDDDDNNGVASPNGGQSGNTCKVTLPDGTTEEVERGSKFMIPDTIKDGTSIYTLEVNGKDCTGREIDVFQNIIVQKKIFAEIIDGHAYRRMTINELAGATWIDACDTDVYIMLSDCNKQNLTSEVTNSFYQTYSKSDVAWALSCHATSKARIHLHLGNNIGTIPSHAFRRVQNLYELVFSSNISTIEEYAFSYAKIGRVVFPPTLTNIGNYAYDRASIGSFVVEEGVKSIGKDLFTYGDVQEADIAGSLTEIPDGTFWDCRSLKNVKLHEGITKLTNCFVGTAIESIELPESITTLEGGVFYACTKLKEISIPKNVTKISRQFCDECTALSKVTIANGPTEIENAAFRKTAIETILIPASVTKIDAKAFEECSKLKTVEIDNKKENVTITNGTIPGLKFLK